MSNLFDRKHTLFLTLFLLFSILFIANAQGDTLEVGTGKKYSSIQDAINGSSCGDKIDLYSGIYTENITVRKNCLSSSPLVIRAVEPEVIIDADKNGSAIIIGSLLDSGYHSFGNVVIDGQTYGIKFRNVGKTSMQSGESYAAIFSNWADDVTVRNISVESSVGGSCELQLMNGSHVDGVNLMHGEGLEVNNLKVSSSSGLSYGIFAVGIIHDPDDRGISIKNSNIQGICKMGIYVNWIENSLIEKSYIRFSYFGDEPSYAPLYLKNTKNITVRYNVIEQSGWSHAIVKFFDQNDNITEKGRFYNNILRNTAGESRAAIDTDNDVTDTYFVNNIIDHPNYIIYSHGNDSNTFTFENNIFPNAKPSDRDNASNTSVKQSGSIYDSVNYTASGNKPSPYYRLSTSSPAIDAGSDMFNYSGSDFDGKKVPSGMHVDIGPFEFYSEVTADSVPPQPPVLISLD